MLRNLALLLVRKPDMVHFLSAQTANSGIVYLIIQTERDEYSGLNGVVVPSLTLYKQLLHFDAFLPTKTTG